MRRTLICYLAREFYCQVLWKEKKYGQNTVLHLVSKHFISCLKVFINLGGKLFPWGFLHRLPRKGKWGGSARGRPLHPSPGGCPRAPRCTAPLGVWDPPAIRHPRLWWPSSPANRNGVPPVLSTGGTESERAYKEMGACPNPSPVWGLWSSGIKGKWIPGEQKNQTEARCARPGSPLCPHLDGGCSVDSFNYFTAIKGQ